MAALRAGDDREPKFFRLLAGCEDGADTPRIDADRLFGEDVLFRFVGRIPSSGSDRKRDQSADRRGAGQCDRSDFQESAAVLARAQCDRDEQLHFECPRYDI